MRSEEFDDARGIEDDAIVEAFWQEELRAGYETALKLIADRFGKSCEYVERLLVEQDAENDGNC